MVRKLPICNLCPTFIWTVFRKVLTTIVQVVFVQMSSSQMILAVFTLNYSIWAVFMMVLYIFSENLLVTFFVFARNFFVKATDKMLTHASYFIFISAACTFIATVNFKVIPFLCLVVVVVYLPERSVALWARPRVNGLRDRRLLCSFA